MKKKDFNLYYAIVFDPIEIQTHQAPQNDRQNLIFVKDTHAVCKDMTRNCPEMVFFEVWFDF